NLIKLNPATVRIYPTVILKNTRLGDLFETGEYKPYTLEKAIKLCAYIYQGFLDNGIKVIKMGLHASEIVEEQMLGGLYHPAFRELCENEIYKNLISELVRKHEIKNTLIVSVPQRNTSKAIGQKKSNIEYFKKNGIELKVVSDVLQHDKLRILSFS
ncbi:MAG: radical SAM protein, partial [Clostridiales bacterium]|nr:radical SAM protein [Clostridiales bacterium]